MQLLISISRSGFTGAVKKKLAGGYVMVEGMGDDKGKWALLKGSSTVTVGTLKEVEAAYDSYYY